MKKIKDKKGFTGIDISIAIVIVIITIGIAVAMIGRISNQVREIEVDTIVSGKLGQEINEIQKRKAQGENLSGNVKTLTIENQVYDLYVNGDKILIKKTVRGQQIDYREVEIEKKKTTMISNITEEERLSKILPMRYDEVNQFGVTFSYEIVILESYYTKDYSGNNLLNFRKKTNNLLEKDKMFGNDLGVFLGTKNTNVDGNGNVINKGEVMFWVSRIADKRTGVPNLTQYRDYVYKRLKGMPINQSDLNNLPNGNDVYKKIEYDEQSMMSFVYLDKNTKSEVTYMSDYQRSVYWPTLSNDFQEVQRLLSGDNRGFWFRLGYKNIGQYLKENVISDILFKEILARKPNLREAIIAGQIDIKDTFAMMSREYPEYDRE